MGGGVVDPNQDSQPAVADSVMPSALAVAPAPSRDAVMKAIAWATDSKNDAVLLGLEES